MCHSLYEALFARALANKSACHRPHTSPGHKIGLEQSEVEEWLRLLIFVWRTGKKNKNR